MQSLQPLSPPAGQDTLIPCFTGQIGAIIGPVCKARDVHSFLQVGRDFPTWFKDRVEKYEFLQDQDFALIPQNGGIKNGRGGDRRSKDYLTSLDMAKELAMVENNDQGRAARRYFIAMEKQALKLAGQAPIEPQVGHLPAETYVVEMDQCGYIRYLEGVTGIQARRVDAAAPAIQPRRAYRQPLGDDKRRAILELAQTTDLSMTAIGRRVGCSRQSVAKVLNDSTAPSQGDLFADVPEAQA